MNKLLLPVIGIVAFLTVACGRDDNPPAETTPAPASQPAYPDTTPPPATSMPPPATTTEPPQSTTNDQPQGTTNDQPNP